MRRSIMFFATLILSVSVFAGETTDRGPAVGEKIPHDLALPDQTGTTQSFENMTGEKGAVLVFFRSAKWCPYCQVQLIDLNMHAREKAEAMGYKLIAISYDKVEILEKFSTKWSIGFPLLSDTGSQVIDAFDLRNEKYAKDHYAYGVPHPILIITDADGLIKKKLYKEHYRDRPETEILLESLAALN